MKNKKAIIGLGALAVMLFGVASSIAYLTDTDTTVNVMTVGNVKIEQLEYERVLDANGNATSELQPYSQLKPIVPAVYKTSTNTEDWADELFDWSSVGAPGNSKVFHEDMKNVIDKFVLVKNTGKKDAYVRTIIAIEDPLALPKDHPIHINHDDKNYKVVNLGTVKIKDVEYSVLEYTYNEAISAGEATRPSLMQVFLDPKATNEDVALFGDTFEILAISQAVQTDGFDSAKEALDEAFGETNATNVIEWFGGLSVVVENGTEEQMAEQISNALQSGQNVIVDENVDIVTVEKDNNGEYNYDAAGATVTLNGEGAGNYGYLSLAYDKDSKAVVENLNVTGSGFVELGHHGGTQATINRGEYTVNNLVIKDFVATLGVSGKNIASAFTHYGVATLTDCVMTGTTTEISGYKAYDAGFVNSTNTTINGGEYGKMYLFEQAHVTINNAKVGTIDSQAIKTSNLGKLTVGSGTTVERINLRAIGGYAHQVVIKAGSKVNTLDLTNAKTTSKIVIEDSTSVENIINPNGITILSAE